MGDSGESGMVSEGVESLWVGAGFMARLTLERPVSLNCFVKRIEPGKGMGVSVAVSEPESQKLYENLLSSLSTTSPYSLFMLKFITPFLYSGSSLIPDHFPSRAPTSPSPH